MTLPCERTRAVKQTRRFLVELMQTKGVSKPIKERARALLKHYPMDIDMQLIGDNPVFAIQDEST